MIMFDMNNRERERFATQLEQLVAALQVAILSLREEDDNAFAIAMMTFALMGPSILSDMQPVFEAMQTVDMADLDDPIPPNKED